MATTTTAPSATAPHLLSSPQAGQPATPITTSAKAKQTPRDVTSQFNYYQDDGQPPAPTYVNKPETYYRPPEVQTHVIHDIRGTEDQYTLDKTGFQIFRHTSQEKDFVDDEKIKRDYYPEVEHVLKTATGASQIFVFDHTIRRQTAYTPQNTGTPSDTDAKDAPPVDPATLRGPVQRVHVDQSYKAGPQRVQHHLPHDADRLLKGRYQIINVWRPIKTIRKDPLGVVDAKSVAEEDLLPVQLIYPDRVGETFAVLPNKDHRWHYLHEQSPEEVTLIKCFDSKVDGRARRVPHSSFVDPGYEGEEARQSIEVRALVFHPDDTE